MDILEVHAAAIFSVEGGSGFSYSRPMGKSLQDCIAPHIGRQYFL